MERFRQTNQNLPETLQALVPAFLPSIPQDPFDGKPLRFKKLSAGYVIYSVGPEKIDNGGKDGSGNLIFTLAH